MYTNKEIKMKQIRGFRVRILPSIMPQNTQNQGGEKIDGEQDLSVDGDYACLPFPEKDFHRGGKTRCEISFQINLLMAQSG